MLIFVKIINVTKQNRSCMLMIITIAAEILQHHPWLVYALYNK